MRTFVFTVALILAGAVAAIAQTDDLPEIGSLEDIRGMTKFYVIANTDDREKIIKVLKKRPELVAVDSPDDAEFFVEFRETSRDAGPFHLVIARGQMDVFVRRDDKKIVAWTDNASGAAYRSSVPGELAGKFLKALKKRS